MDENKKSLNSGGPWWKPAMQLFSEVSTWIAVPIIVAVIGGKALDTRFDTKPLFVLVCAGLAFLLSAYGIVKKVKEYTKKIKDK